MAISHDARPQDAEDAASIFSEHFDLTPRQAEVLHWIAEGKTNSEIATILACSFNTVKTHLKEIFQRLGVHSRTAAAACAYRAHIQHAGTHPLSPKRVMPDNAQS